MTSVFIAASFLALLFSGTVLFVSPPGRVANWGNWRMVGLTKHDWASVHTWFAATFFVAAVFHLIFNIRPLLNYFRDRLTRRPGLRWEWVVAVALCGVVFAGVQMRIPPFSTLLNLGERVKQGWEVAQTAAPLPHAELLSFKELANQAKVPYETAVERLEARGFKAIRPEVIVQNLAQSNQVSAQRLYEIIQGQRGGGGGGGEGHGTGKVSESGAQAEKGSGHGSGGGAGWQTLAQYCSSREIALTNAMAKLQAKGIKFTADQTLREIALANGYDRPYEIVELLGGTKP